ncbi:hypothetical protein PC129_g19341 [Phytophthora cactorum]|uniref:Uncharacterized protein n=1 Tax=Phytophthora cactorum TaxID=29920 RepID=A0A8T1BD67_9STRA|nr:hypothetical protein Pcac1_g20875 [Phytophthora cactorum]KAG2900179.1 hypothetical protein PC115_g16312 [Phytophthora cactorum]KAG2931978.1 hypothetical protein PC114_g1944 [Phytophthora cactorum]KAG2936579.1 hypothetical protein PC117_g11992 [Phytophthora cactorum]KAG2996285.1 hypothetical protein PC119_g17870 [Phytophthora cactorum]
MAPVLASKPETATTCTPVTEIAQREGGEWIDSLGYS